MQVKSFGKIHEMKKKIIIEVEPMEGTDDLRITTFLNSLVDLAEKWAKDNFQNKPKVFLEKNEETRV